MLFLPPGLRPARAGVIPRPGGSSGCSTAPSRPRGSDSWIIRGVQGEFYPCKSDVFEATYERVADDERTDSVSGVRGDPAASA